MTSTYRSLDDLNKNGITVCPTPINSGLIAVVFKGTR